MCHWSAKEREIWRSREEKKKDEINNIPQQPGSQGLADYCMKRELIAQSFAGELGELQRRNVNIVRQGQGSTVHSLLLVS